MIALQLTAYGLSLAFWTTHGAPPCQYSLLKYCTTNFTGLAAAAVNIKIFDKITTLSGAINISVKRSAAMLY